MEMSSIQPSDLQPLSFRVKKFDYSRYHIDSPTVKGILSLADVVTNVGRVPASTMPRGQTPSGDIQVGMGTMHIVSFTNQGDKHRPTPEGQLSSKPKSELTSYIIADRNHEPWNEYALDTQPVVLLKTRTILSKVESLVGCYNQLGDPLILAQHSTVHTVSSQPAPEFGMR